MTSDSETQAVREFLFENPDHFDTALAVYESWPAIRDEVCGRFLERLRSRIETADELKPYASDLQVGCQYRGQPKYSNVLWLYRDRWQTYEGASAITSQRTANSDGVRRPRPDRMALWRLFSLVHRQDATRRQATARTVRRETEPSD